MERNRLVLLLESYVFMRETVVNEINFDQHLGQCRHGENPVIWEWLTETFRFANRHPFDVENAMFNMFMNDKVLDYIRNNVNIDEQNLADLIEEINEYQMNPELFRG
jgi:hypothetical protein